MNHLSYLDRSIATYDRDAPANDYHRGHLDALKVARAELATLALPMLLFCPACGLQHVDAPDEAAGWSNPPHKSHLCHRCGTIWRPADVPTTGVPRIETRGTHDSWNVDHGVIVNACETPGDAALRYIERLRADFGNVTILCDDDEAWTKDQAMAIEVVGEWTGWKPTRFYGESVLQCLAKAVTSQSEAVAA